MTLPTVWTGAAPATGKNEGRGDEFEEAAQAGGFRPIFFPGYQELLVSLLLFDDLLSFCLGGGVSVTVCCFGLSLKLSLGICLSFDSGAVSELETFEVVVDVVEDVDNLAGVDGE